MAVLLQIAFPAPVRSARLAALPEDPVELAREAVRIQLRARSAGILSGTDLNFWVTGSLTCDTRARIEDALGGDN